MPFYTDDPIVMGILNATPDSFYNKGRGSGLYELEQKAMQMIADGAGILDIGGQSTRPNANLISAEDELARVLPLVKLIHEKFPSTTLSIDTFYSQVAEACLHAGARIINDISAGNMDKQMLPLVAKYQAPYICMHMQGTPKTMQHDPVYNDVVGSVYTFFANKLEQFHQFGIKDVILDVGFGFGKTITHNYQLLQQLNTFSSLGKPLLVGISRKSMVYKPLNSTSEEALNGTSALHMIALERGAKILRVHDVKEAKEIVTLHKMLHAS